MSVRRAYHDGKIVRIQVQCYAGFKADERPVRFELGGRSYGVEDIVDRWYGPSCSFFKVRADDGNLYILSHDETANDEGWRLESFRRGKDEPASG